MSLRTVPGKRVLFEPASPEKTGQPQGKAEKLLFIITAPQVTAAVKTKLAALDPVYEEGMWVCWVRLRKCLKVVIGKDHLPILLPHTRLAELIMLQAHTENHDQATMTLARSRTQAWIHRGRYLARKVISSCRKCKVRKARLETQRMGDLLKERCNPGS